MLGRYPASHINDRGGVGARGRATERAGVEPNARASAHASGIAGNRGRATGRAGVTGRPRAAPGRTARTRAAAHAHRLAAPHADRAAAALHPPCIRCVFAASSSRTGRTASPGRSARPTDRQAAALGTAIGEGHST